MKKLDQKIENLLWELSEIGIDYDACAFGLPVHKEEPKKQMRRAVLKFLETIK